MLRAVRPEAPIDLADAFKLYCDVGCEAPSAGGFDTTTVTPRCCQSRRRSFKIPIRYHLHHARELNT